MRTLYFDCFSGASGDMVLGALFELGVDSAEVARLVGTLGIADYSIEPVRVDRSGISAIHANVKAADGSSHRHLFEIERMIAGSGLSDAVKAMSTEIFRKLGAAEARVHNIALEEVHFHEVGALDSIIDIVGCCVGFEILGIEQFACSKLHVGSGTVEMSHGRFPVPPPAVAELVKGIPIYSADVEGELLTPTAAAILSTVCSRFGPLPEFRIENTGYGAGTKNYDGIPNVLRLMIGESPRFRAEADRHGKHGASEKLVVLETNLDDVSPEILGYVMETAFEGGALDCWFTPIQMKKNRPATLLSLLCDAARSDDFIELLVRETPTLGVRIREVERMCLTREVATVATRFGEVPVKIARLGDRVTNAKPEFEAMKGIARREKLPLRDVEAEIIRCIEKKWHAAVASA